MTNDSQPPATVTYVSESKFVSFPPRSPAQARTAEALLLRALADDRVDRPETSPLVALSRCPLHLDHDSSYANRSMTGALKVDMGNNLDEIGQALLPSAHLPTPSLLRTRKLTLDEAHLHALLSSWEGMNELDKLFITANAMPSEQTLTFSVNLSKKRQLSIGADLKKPFRKIRNELAEIADLGPTLVVLEHDPDGRLHLHGMVMTEASQAKLRKLLLKLGGASEDVRFRNTWQVKIKPATSPLGWGHYMAKDLLQLPANQSGTLIYSSHAARRLGKAHLEDLRTASVRKLGIKPDFRGRANLSRRSSTSSKRCVRRTSGGVDPRVDLRVSLSPLLLLSGHKANLGNLGFQRDGLTLTNYD